MKNIFWLLLIIPLLQACATHAPMSEMVMFNKSVFPDSTSNVRSGVITYFHPGITGSTFEEFRNGDYASYTDGEFPSITLHTLRLRKDGISRSLSFGRGFGIDWTRRLKQDHYGSLALSIPYSGKVSLHRVVLNRRWTGLSTGVFTGLDTRRYNRVCGVAACDFWPDAGAFLVNSGIRTRYLIRDPRSPGLVLTGAFEVGYIWTSKEPFVGFNVSVSSLY